MSEWIDVKDRLPENGQSVKIRIQNDNTKKNSSRKAIFYSKESFFKEDTFCNNKCCSFCTRNSFRTYCKIKDNQSETFTLTYWMPLPQTPKE